MGKEHDTQKDMFAQAQGANMVQGGNSQTLLLIVKMRSTWAGVSAKVTVNGHVWIVVNYMFGLYNYDDL